MAQITPTSGAPPQIDLERLKSTPGKTIEAEKARLHKATREFESFFLYYMLKTMRETVDATAAKEEAPMGGGMGKETYQQMFDMEISRNVVRGGHRSLSEMLYKSMEKLVEAHFQPQPGKDAPTGGIKTPGLQPKSSPIPLERPMSPHQIHQGLQLKPISRPNQPAFSPIAATRRIAPAPDAIRTQYGHIIDEAARESRLDSALISSVIKAESNGDSQAVSPAGAKGLMQLADSTASEMGVNNPFDARSNVLGGSRYLRTLLDRFGDLRLALAAYNAGPATVERHGGVPPFRETQDYITRVTSYLKESEKDQPTPLK